MKIAQQKKDGDENKYLENADCDHDEESFQSDNFSQ